MTNVMLFLAAICIGFAAANSAEDHKQAGDVLLPTETEYEVLKKFGSAIKFMAAFAWEDPKGLISFIDTVSASIPQDKDTNDITKRLVARAENSESSEEKEDCPGEKELAKAIEEHGVYNAMIGKAFVEGVILEYTEKAVTDAIARHGCKDTPETCPPELDWKKIIEEALGKYKAGAEKEISERGQSGSKRKLIARLLELLQ